MLDAGVFAGHGIILHHHGGLAWCEWEESVTIRKWVACMMCNASNRIRSYLHTLYVLFSGNVVVRRLVLSHVDSCMLRVSHRIVGLF